MKKIVWFIFVILCVIIGSYSLTFIQNNNADSQIFQLNKFESCKLLYLESILTNASIEDYNTSKDCADSALLNAVDENNGYLKNKEKIIYYWILSISTSVILIILSIKHPFGSNKLQ